MEDAKHLFGYDNLAFFGSVNASISHELKNIMAIISETAGLLSDLSDMAHTGTPVDPDLLRSNADSIMEEMQRGFKTIRQMNRFCHSIDAPIVAVDLMELLDLVRHLSAYLAFAGMVRLAPWRGDPPLATTCPFILQTIVYKIVEQHFKQTGPGAALDITIQSRSDLGWQIVFSNLSMEQFQMFPDDQIKKAAAAIAVNLEWDRADDPLQLHVPLTI